jgi:lipopolysaccharide export system protein LptC
MLMLLLGGLTLWLKQAIESPPPAGPVARTHGPVAVVERFTVTQLDARGVPEYRLSAAKMLHFADEGTTELVEPRLVRSQADSAITVSAERGRVDHDYRQAHFYENVRLVRAATGDADELRMQTEYLHVVPDRDLARTDKHVTITEGRSTLSGVGMEYNRGSGQLRLLSAVKGTFDASKK